MLKKAVAYLFLISCLVVLAEAQQKTFMWKVNSQQGTLYLLGSIHAAQKSFYPLPAHVENAFTTSKNLVVEVDITSDEGAEAAFDRFEDSAFYPRGDTLQKHISQETFKKVMKKLDMYTFDTYRIQRLRPWALASLLSAMEMHKSSAEAEYGVDLYFLKRAPYLRKEIISLESMELQAGLFENLSDREQELYLLLSLDGLDTEVQGMDQLMKIWRSGDTNSLEQFLASSAFNHPGMPTLRKKVLTERNKNMLVKIEQLLSEPGSDFVVVGAAHLIGKDGLVELLTKKGYEVLQQ